MMQPFKQQPTQVRRCFACQGFSMVELLLAAFLLSVGVLGLTALQVGAMKQSTLSRDRVTAAYIANQVLQAIQIEGQQSYYAKLQGNNHYPTTRKFTTMTGVDEKLGIGIDWNNRAGFNVDGVYISRVFKDAQGNDVVDTPIIISQNLDRLVPDVNKRGTVYKASWARTGYRGAVPGSGVHCQEFVVNVEWTDSKTSEPKYLSLSRNIRY